MEHIRIYAFATHGPRQLLNLSSRKFTHNAREASTPRASSSTRVRPTRFTVSPEQRPRVSGLTVTATPAAASKNATVGPNTRTRSETTDSCQRAPSAPRNPPSSTVASASAATSPPPAAATATAAAPSSLDLNRALVIALAEQFKRESLPWIQDLVVPLFEGPPPPLTDTEPPEQLADRDSRFLTVNGIRLHYKMALPGEREGPAAAAGAVAATNRTPPAGAWTTAAPSPTFTASSPSSSSSSSSAAAVNTITSTPGAAAAAAAATESNSWVSQRPSFDGSSRLRLPEDSNLGRPNPGASLTLLLLHGLNGSTFNWRLLMDDLAAYVSPATGGCRVVAYDRPPYGLSQRPLTWQREEDNPYTLEGGARLAAGLLDALLGPSWEHWEAPSPSPVPRAQAAPERKEQRAAGQKAPLHQGPGNAASGSNRSSSCGTSTSSSSSSSSSGSSSSGGDRVVLVGHSAGAAVAVETALRYPERICGLVLIAPAISTDPWGFLARADFGQLLRFAWTRALLSADGPGLNYVRRQVLKRKAELEEGRLGVYLDEREVPQEIIDGYLRPLRAHDWDRGTLLVYRSLQVSGAPLPLERLRVPVLIVQGREDRTVPLETAQAVEAALRRRPGPGAVTEMVVLEGCAHVPMDEQPLKVLAAITDFVNRHCCG